MNDIYLAVGEQLLVIVGLMSTGAVVQRASRKQADLALTFPLCIRRGESYIVPQSWFKLAISSPCIFEDRSGSLNHISLPMYCVYIDRKPILFFKAIGNILFEYVDSHDDIAPKPVK